MKKYFISTLITSVVIALYPSISHAQQDYEFTQRITSLKCIESEVNSGGIVHRDLHPEECLRMPGVTPAPATPTSQSSIPIERDTAGVSHQEDSLAPTGSPLFYILFAGIMFTAGVLLYACKRKAR